MCKKFMNKNFYLQEHQDMISNYLSDDDIKGKCAIAAPELNKQPATSRHEFLWYDTSKHGTIVACLKLKRMKHTQKISEKRSFHGSS